MGDAYSPRSRGQSAPRIMPQLDYYYYNFDPNKSMMDNNKFNNINVFNDINMNYDDKFLFALRQTAFVRLNLQFRGC